jgi:hypothetical protein
MVIDDEHTGLLTYEKRISREFQTRPGKDGGDSQL